MDRMRNGIIVLRYMLLELNMQSTEDPLHYDMNDRVDDGTQLHPRVKLVPSNMGTPYHWPPITASFLIHGG